MAADSCIKQCHPLTVEPLQTCSLVATDRCRLGVCRGNNNNLKGLLLFTLLSLFLYLLLSLPYCWALSVVLVNVLLSCLDVIYVTGCEVDLSPSSPNSLNPLSLPSPTLPSSPNAWQRDGSLHLSQPGSSSKDREEWFGGGRCDRKIPFQTSTCSVNCGH